MIKLSTLNANTTLFVEAALQYMSNRPTFDYNNGQLIFEGDYDGPDCYFFFDYETKEATAAAPASVSLKIMKIHPLHIPEAISSPSMRLQVLKFVYYSQNIERDAIDEDNVIN